jgi:HK97 family phage prohead protease
MGRTTSGTLRLSVDDKGLRYEVDIPDTTAGRDLLVSLKRGDITQSSFAFIVEEDSWDQGEKGAIRTIKKVSRLYDVSAVTYPAYEEASVGLRSFNTWKEKIDEGVMKDKEETKQEQINSWNRGLAARKLKIVKLK